MQTITISIHMQRFTDLLEKVKELGVKEVYFERESHTIHYSAWDPERRVFLRAPVRLPHTDIILATHRYRSDDGIRWDDGEDGLVARSQNKRDMIKLLRKVNATTEFVQKLAKVKLDELNTLIDASDAESDEFTIRERRERAEWTLEINAFDGHARTALLRVNRDHQSVDYILEFHNWEAIIDGLRRQQEQPLVSMGVRLIEGKVEIEITK